MPFLALFGSLWVILVHLVVHGATLKTAGSLEFFYFLFFL
jgi:hypothetical protein